MAKTREKERAAVLMIPALSIREGRPVVIKKRNIYDHLEDDDGDPIPPKEFVEELVKRHGQIVYIMDIDGIERNRPQYDVLKALSKVAEIWVDAGSRSGEALIDIFTTGAEKTVISTKVMEGLGDIDAAAEISDKLMLCIDYNRRILARNEEVGRMTPQGLADLARRKGIRDVVLADYGRKRKMELNRDVIYSLVRTGANIYVGGRVRKKDRKALYDMGATGGLLDMMAIIKKW